MSIIPDTNSSPTVDGGQAALPYLCYGEHDPSVIATSGMPGIVYIRISKQRNGQFGAVGLFQKVQTAGTDTNWQPFSAGGGNAYTPSVPADWDLPLPTNYAEGLDQLAARVEVLENASVAASDVSYTPNDPADYPAVITNAQEGLDSLAAIVNLFNPKQVYVDVSQGSDTTGTGGVFRPFQTIPAALAYIAGAGPGSYMLELAPGSYAGAPIAWPNNVFLNAPTNTVEIDHAISVTAGAGDIWSFYAQNIGFAQNIVVDFSLALSATLRFFNCGVRLVRTDSNPNVTANINYCQILHFDISGTVTVDNSISAGPFTVQLGALVFLRSSTLVVGPANIIGTLAMFGSNATIAVTGTGTILRDATSDTATIFAGGSLATTTLAFLDTASGVGYTPAVPADWSVVPGNVGQALNELASRQTIVEERAVTVGEAGAKAIALVNAPFNPNDVSVSFLGVEQVDSVDFAVAGSTINWNGLGMDAIGVVAGDIIVVTYQKS